MSNSPGKKAGKTIRPAKAITGEMLDQFLPKLSNAIVQCDGNLTIDCSRTKRIDAVGVAVLLQAYNSCRDADGGLVLTHVNDTITTIFRILGLDRYFEVKPKTPAREKERPHEH